MEQLNDHISTFKEDQFDIAAVAKFENLLNSHMATTTKIDRKAHLDMVKNRRIEPKF